MSAEKGFAAVLLLGLLSAAEAGIKTWVAEVPQNWNYNEGWSPAGVPTSADDVVFDGTGNGDCNLSGTVEVNSLNVTAAYNGTLALGNHDINIDAGNATFDGGYLTSTGGALVFRASTGTQTFSPKSGATYPGISKSGAGTVTVATNNLTAGSLSVSGGTWDWGASTLTHSVTSITTSGSSTMTFGANTVRVSGNVDLSGLATLNANSGTLELNGASAQTFTPMAGATHPTIKQTGTGTTTVATNSLTAQAVQVIAGTLDFSANALNLTTTGNVTVSGGTLTLTNSDAAVGGDFTVSGGTLDCPGYSKSFSVAGSFSWTTGNGTLNSGTLTLNGTATGKTLDFTGGSFYNLTVNGSGGVWTANTDITLNGSLTLTAGTLDISANATR
ncbi:MAG TPA: hypothetical protein VK465_02550, partial [Fibrobacteria bacterium]|nr:hypothetical protein [Fibrobacteria bacterium]